MWPFKKKESPSQAMKKIRKYAKAIFVLLAIAFSALCLRWIIDIFWAASYLPWYKIAGGAALIFSLLGISIVSLYSDNSAHERRKHKLLIESEFELSGEVARYFMLSGIKYDCEKSGFVERAATKAAFEENNKLEGGE